MNPETKNNLLNADTYKRLAFMVIFILIFGIVELVIYAIALGQIIHLLFRGTHQEEVKAIGTSVSSYTYDIVKFLTFDTEHLPFPFEPWKYSKKEDEPKNKEI